VNDLNEWLEAWKPIRTSFERLSLSNSAVELACILLDAAGIGRDRVIPDFRQGVISTQGCGARYWWIRHKEIAELVPPSGPIKEDLHLFESINEANAVAREFQNCAEHAGDLLSLLPFDLAPMFPNSLSRFHEDVGKEKLNELNYSTGWVGAHKQGKHLWIAALFLPTDQWPWWWPSRLIPNHCDYYWADMVEIAHPHGFPEVYPMALGLNPFLASVVLIDAMRSAVNGTPQTTGSSSILPQINLQLNQVRYAGQCYDVSSDGALLLSKLVESHPHEVAASGLFSKPSDVKKRLPMPLRELIKTEGGKGYSLKIQ